MDLRTRFPHLPLGDFPSRVERVDGLTPPSVELWVKREDECGAAYGGNKVRKLEFLFGAARAAGRRRLVTFGPWGSHHVVATAIYARRAGFTVDAVMFPQPIDAHVRELLLADQAAGARLQAVGNVLGVLPARARALLDDGAEWLAGGGSSVVGTLGWVSAAQEIAAQVRGGALPPPDVIYVALGSAGTVAGLTFALWGERAPEIVGVKVVDSIVASAGAVRRLERGLARLIGRDTARLQMGRPPRLRVAGGFLGRGFGHASPASEAAVTQAARLGLRLDPIYTGKVMAALLDDARRGRLDGKRVLFLHTFNTVDLAPLIARGPGPSALPAPLRKLFDTPAPAAALAT